ncbi:hypothetical protein TELCIR_03385 [Teladorsagia circumcincta]|uniref:Uncharacterized protein n=1 Tax=Teladorsagia circumcincta TaxID=45464 RepID=A0A2G9UWJ6_TELCI|nr:hypothetical protein TELCIR_03385 [Teladorsagia circumcincta]
MFRFDPVETGAVRFFTDLMACRTSEERFEGTTFPSVVVDNSCGSTLAYQFENFRRQASFGDFQTLCPPATIVKMFNEPIVLLVDVFDNGILPYADEGNEVTPVIDCPGASLPKHCCSLNTHREVKSCAEETMVRSHVELWNNSDVAFSPLIVLAHDMATNASESDGQNTQTKSKLDNLSREDLIRFVKRQLEHVNLSKMEIKKLKHSLEEKDSTINELLAENTQLKSSEQERSERQDATPVENGSTSSADMERLLELNAQLTNDVAVLKKERLRHEEDLAAVLQTNNHLRSQLDDVVQEAAALREQQTATDVFSLELQDYEKKMVQLNKSLKDAESALEAVKLEKEELLQQLSTQKGSSDRVNTECSVLQRQLQEIRNELNEEKSRNRELSTAIDRLQDNFNVLATARNDERVSLEAKIAHNEELTSL